MLTELGIVKEWARGKLDGASDDVLTRCIEAASDALSGLTDRDLELAAFTEILDGDRARGKGGEILALDRGRFPVWHAADPGLVTVTENGLALTVATGYSATADVILDGVGLDRPLRLVRRPTTLQALASYSGLGRSSWAPGVQNISVGYFAGYAEGEVPEKAVHLCCKLAWLFFSDPQRIGASSSSKAGKSVSYLGELTDLELAMVEDLKAR